jgi:hypothetical protein
MWRISMVNPYTVVTCYVLPSWLMPLAWRMADDGLIHSLDGIFHEGYIYAMKWEVEYTDEFGQWWSGLSEQEQISVAASVQLLEERGPSLGFPHSSGIHGSKHGHMRELRTQHLGRPFRTLYAFDPLRNAILLIGGDKTGDGRWYDVNVPLADRLYDEHLEQLRKEGKTNG